MSQIRASLMLLTITAAAATSAQAQVFVVAPNSFTTVAGGGAANTAPFNNQSRYQQIFAASQFSAITAPTLITQIAFRPTANQAAFTRTLSSIQFNLSTTSQSVAGLSSTFASNVGANDTVVFNGSWTPSSLSTAGPGNTKQFDILLNLTTPFLYNPAAGNLLLDIRNSSPSITPFLVDLGADANTRLVFADANPSTTTTGSIQNFGIATRFAFASASAPEPGSITFALIVGVPVAGLVLRRKKGIGKANR